MTYRKGAKYSFLLFLLFASAVIFLFFFRLGDRPLWSSDEGRFGEIAREMWESRDFIHPRFNYVDFFEKPVLAPWLSAFSIGLLGATSFAVRLPLACAAVLCIGMTGLSVRRLYDNPTAMLAMMFQATGLGYVLVGRFAVIDVLLTLFLSGAFFSLLAAILSGKKRHYLAASIFMGAAFLSKGLVGLALPALVVLIFLIWEQRLAELKKIPWIWGTLIILVMTLPWILAMAKHEPEFLSVFFVHQQFSRFAGGSFGRTRPFWFYIPILFGIAMPWTFFIPAAIRNALQPSEHRSIRRFLLCWAGITFIFFSASKGKLPYYILPVAVPLAVLFADLFNALFRSSLNAGTAKLFHRSWQVLYGVLFAAIPGFILFLLIWGPKVIEATPVMLPYVAAGSIFSLAALGLSLFYYRRAQFVPALWILAIIPYAILTTTSLAMEALNPVQSTAGFAKVIRERHEPGDMVAIFASPDHFSDLPFHLQRRVAIVGGDRGTLTAESREDESGHDSDWFFDTDRFVALFKTGEQKIFLLTDEEKLPEILNAGMPAGKIYLRQSHKVLLVNRTD